LFSPPSCPRATKDGDKEEGAVRRRRRRSPQSVRFPHRKLGGTMRKRRMTSPDPDTTPTTAARAPLLPPNLWALCLHRFIHYRKQSLHRELEASARAKPPALGEAPLRREPTFWLSAKVWPTVNSTVAESFLLSALGEGFGWRLPSSSRDGRPRPLNSPRA
jgi:hypothetical protein